MQTENKTNQIWYTAFLVLPLVLYSALAKEFAPDSSTSFVLSAGFGALGGMFGMLAYHSLKERNWPIKILALVGIVAIGVTGFWIYKQNTSQLVELNDIETETQDWVSLEIGALSFDAPHDLTLLSSVVLG